MIYKYLAVLSFQKKAFKQVLFPKISYNCEILRTYLKVISIC
jgi:uncharacterized protein YozE (UPF0346 family)